MPFLKVDKGLADEPTGAQLMKPIPGLDDLLERAVQAGVFGTKMRSVIAGADATGSRPSSTSSSRSVVRSWAHGLVPIIEPEVDIHSPHEGRGRGAAAGARSRGTSTMLGSDQNGDAQAHDPDGRRLLPAD